MFSEAHYHKRNLPHIYVPDATYFITYRLYGSIPIVKLQEIKEQFEQNKKFSNKEEQYEEQTRFFINYDSLLDTADYGPSYLNRRDVAQIVKNSLFYYDKKQYHLISFCIMPNHIHLVMEKYVKSKSPDKLMQVIKGFSAREINKCFNTSGSIWQPESYDHIVRDEDELYRIINYVIYNPVKAKLVENWADWMDTYLCEEFRECN